MGRFELAAIVSIPAFMAGFIIGVLLTSSVWEFGAIKRGYAAYCPETGELRWVGECEDTQ